MQVFDHIPSHVARERSIITSGRRFTWAGPAVAHLTRQFPKP